MLLDGVLPLDDLVAVVRQVEHHVLVEDQADPAGVLPVWLLEGGGGVELLLGHLHQDGAVWQGESQAAHVDVLEGFSTVGEVGPENFSCFHSFLHFMTFFKLQLCWRHLCGLHLY